MNRVNNFVHNILREENIECGNFMTLDIGSESPKFLFEPIPKHISEHISEHISGHISSVIMSDLILTSWKGIIDCNCKKHDIL